MYNLFTSLWRHKLSNQGLEIFARACRHPAECQTRPIYNYYIIRRLTNINNFAIIILDPLFQLAYAKL